jgi:polyphosphate kinase 2 (PPK2 family)
LTGEKIWKHRYRSIAGLEKHLHCNGTRVVKFFLHLSRAEQRKRFLERIEDPKKSWKFVADDLKERGYWKEYMKAYEACLEATSTREAPWYVVPADDKYNARLIISSIVLGALQDLDLSYPEADAKRKRELRAFKKMLTK